MNKRIRKKYRRQMLLQLMENMCSNQALVRYGEGWVYFPELKIQIDPGFFGKKPTFEFIGDDPEFIPDVRKDWYYG